MNERFRTHCKLLFTLPALARPNSKSIRKSGSPALHLVTLIGKSTPPNCVF
jgi:hypothetical protein